MNIYLKELTKYIGKSNIEIKDYKLRTSENGHILFMEKNKVVVFCNLKNIDEGTAAIAVAKYCHPKLEVRIPIPITKNENKDRQAYIEKMTKAINVIDQIKRLEEKDEDKPKPAKSNIFRKRSKPHKRLTVPRKK